MKRGMQPLIYQQIINSLYLYKLLHSYDYITSSQWSYKYFMSSIIGTNPLASTHLKQEKQLDRLVSNGSPSLPCHPSITKEGHQLQSSNEMNQISEDNIKSQLKIKRALYRVVLKTFSELISLVALSFKFKDILEVIQFSFSQEETSISLCIGIIYNKVLDSSIIKQIQQQLQQKKGNKYFFFHEKDETVFSQMQKHLNLNLFLLSLVKTITQQFNKTTLMRVRQDGKGNCFDYKMYASQSYLQSDVIINKPSQNKNTQSSQYIIQTSAETDHNYFKNVNQILKKQDSLALKTLWDNSLKNKLENIKKNWNLYQCMLHNQMTTFTMLNMYKKYKLNAALNYNNESQSIQINFYEHIYPKMSHFLDFFSKKLGIKTIEDYLLAMRSHNPEQGKIRQLDKNNNFSKDNLLLEEQEDSLEVKMQKQLQLLREQLQIEQNTADKIFYQLLCQEKKKTKKENNNILINESMQLREFVNSCQDFYKNSSHWSSLFASFYHLFNQANNKDRQFFSNIQHERLVQNQCLGCSKFFILGQNIYDEQANKSPIKVFSSIRKLKQIEANLKDQICGMLNSGGGIILFNCQQKYRGIYPEGNAMTQKDKQEYQQRIYSYSSQFYPKLQIKDHIHLTFVPIVSLEESQPGTSNQKRKYAGEQGLLKGSYLYTNRSYCKGLFVTRIKVRPAEPSLVYFWYVTPRSTNQGETRNFCQVNNLDGTCTKIKDRQIAKLIKRRMHEFYVKQSLTDEEKHLLMYPKSYIQHECPEPDVGITMAEISKFQKVERPAVDNLLEDQYNYLTLLVAKRQHHQKIRQNFQRGKLNFQMRKPFKEEDFKIANNTVALYHKEKFQQIFQYVSNDPNLIFHGRQTLVINVTSFLKLEKRNQLHPLSQKQFNYIGSIFAKRFANQTLKAFRFKTANNKSKYEYEYYLLSQTKISNLYLYYLINESMERAVFKNPYLLDKLSQAEREQRMVMLYDRKGRNELMSNFGDKRNQSQIVDMLQFNCHLEDSTIIDHYSDIDLYELLYGQQRDQATKQASKTDISKDQENKQSIEQQGEYFYESWQQVLKEYDYSIDGGHRSQNLKDL